MTKSDDDMPPEWSVEIDDFINDLVADFGADNGPFDYSYWAQQIQIARALDLPGFDPPDPGFWSAVITELRRRDRIQRRS